MTSEQILRLLAAERRGRALVERLTPSQGDVWQMEIGSGPDGAALLTAARWAEILGAKTLITLANCGGEDPVLALLTESARRQNQVVEGKSSSGVNRIVTPGINGVVKEADIPDAYAAWKSPLATRPEMLARVSAGSPQLSCAQCRAIDRRAIEDFAIPGLCLMENAAVAATVLVLDLLNQTPGSEPVVVAVGGGNNGGDGLAVARGLWELGIEVTVLLLKPPESLGGDALTNYQILGETTKVKFLNFWDNPEAITEPVSGARLIVDALLGTGFRGGLSGAFATAISLINRSGKPVLALDIPSGLNGDNGTVASTAILASHTITFAAVKNGLTTGSGPSHTGELYLAGIGAPSAALRLAEDSP
ncbi:MAG: NAD(P)H-hydrate epimerase [Planctomycetota bacterium]|jgi:hydroxyethylthiazole kinase-like uncharacterized protein yjeF|nr:NAD(P)H-hydrate epimerase [Planctomycetota bacterium]